MVFHHSNVKYWISTLDENSTYSMNCVPYGEAHKHYDVLVIIDTACYGDMCSTLQKLSKVSYSSNVLIMVHGLKFRIRTEI
jgi:hypothetical protein